MRVGLIAGSLVLGLVSAGGLGCSSATYKGASPFNPEPVFKGYYFGMNFKFGVDRLSEYHHPYETPAAMAGGPMAASLIE